MPRANAISRSAYNRKFQADKAGARKAAGLCVECGNPAPPSKRNPGRPAVRCAPCAKVANRRSAGRLARLRGPWRALGLCTVCGIREAMRTPGSTTPESRCAVCAEQQDEYKAGRAS